MQNLALAAGTFVLCGVVLEVILRIAGYGNLEIYQPDPKLYWRLAPNQRCFTKIGHQPVRVNSLGTRGPEFSPAKPANTFRVLSLGDSRTFGWGMAEEQTYSARLGALLESASNSTQRVEVINAGVNAWSFQQMLVYLRETAAQYHPDVVVVGEANLWTQFSEKNSPEFVRKFMWRVRLKNLLRRFATYHYLIEVKLKGFYEKHRTKFIPVDPKQDQLFKAQQQADPDAVFKAAVRGLCITALTNGARPVLLYLPTQDELTSTNEVSVQKVKTEIANELQIPLVDIRETAAPQANALYLDGDPVHFNERGNQLIAEKLFEVVAPLQNREQTGNH